MAHVLGVKRVNVTAKNWGRLVLMSSSAGPDFSAFLRIMSSRFLLLILVEEVSNI